MGFGGEVENRIGLVAVEHPGHGRRVADIGVLEDVALVARHGLQAAQAGGVGQFVDIDHFVPGGRDYMTDHG